MIHAGSRSRRWPVLGFLSGLTLVYVACLTVMAMPEFTRGRALAFAVTFDLTLTVPVLYYFLMVRRAGFPKVTVIPVFVISVLVAAALLPDDRQQFLSLIEIAAVAAELFILGYVIHKAMRFQKRMRGEADPAAAIQSTFRETLGESRLVRFASAEATILYFAFFSWGRKAPSGNGVFSYHRNSGWGQLLLVLGFFGVAELIFVHWLLLKWSPVAAWIASGLSFYGLIWLLGDYRAMTLRPLALGTDSLRVRVGLRWETEIPLRAVEKVWVPSALEDPPSGTLNISVMNTPDLMITLGEETSATGLFGVRKRFRTLGLSVDHPEIMQRDLAAPAL